VAEVLTNFDGVAPAVSSSALRTGNLPDTPILRSVLNNFNPKRSGDIYVVFEPHRFINDFDGLVVACTHGSPWSYDTFLPVIAVVPGVRPQTIYRRVSPLDIAPALVGAKPPSGAEGNPLFEVMAATLDGCSKTPTVSPRDANNHERRRKQPLVSTKGKGNWKQIRWGWVPP